MTKTEIAREITDKLLDQDMLNKADYTPDITALRRDVTNVITDCLHSYTMMRGNIIQED